MSATANPFRIVHGTVRDEYFTDREAELERFRRVLEEPAAKLVVYGHRRMGKSSCLEEAVRRVNACGGHAIIADLSTASAMADVGNRVLEGAARSLGRRWRDVLGGLLDRFQGSVTLSTDPASGLLLPSLAVSLRDEAAEAQGNTLAKVLDTIDALADERGENIGIVLDEFQEIAEIGGERAEWQLRGTVQHHQHVSYIFAGSKPHLVGRMLSSGRAFYQLADEYQFGPIEPRHLSDWIDERMAAVGLEPQGAGQICVEVAGPRTRDVVALVRKCVDRLDAGGRADREVIRDAFMELIEEKDEGVRIWWSSLTQVQQNVLRAVAGSTAGLTSGQTRVRFSLPSTGSASNAAKALLNAGHLVRTDNGSGYVFDNPFVRGWVVMHALKDVGIALDPLYVASRVAGYL